MKRSKVGRPSGSVAPRLTQFQVMAILLAEGVSDAERGTLLRLIAPNVRANDVRLHPDVRSAARAVLHAGLGNLTAAKPSPSQIRDAARDLANAYEERAPALASDDGRLEAYAVEAERALWWWFRHGCTPEQVHVISSDASVQDMLVAAPWRAAWGPATARLGSNAGTGLPEPDDLPGLRVRAERVGQALREAAAGVGYDTFVELLRIMTADRSLLFGALSERG